MMLLAINILAIDVWSCLKISVFRSILVHLFFLITSFTYFSPCNLQSLHIQLKAATLSNAHGPYSVVDEASVDLSKLVDREHETETTVKFGDTRATLTVRRPPCSSLEAKHSFCIFIITSPCHLALQEIIQPYKIEADFL